MLKCLSHNACDRNGQAHTLQITVSGTHMTDAALPCASNKIRFSSLWVCPAKCPTMMSWNSKAIDWYLRPFHVKQMYRNRVSKAKQKRFLTDKNVKRSAVSHQRVQFCMHPMFVEAVSTTPIGMWPRSITFSLFPRAFWSSSSTKFLSSVFVTFPKETQKSIGSPHMLFSAIALRPGVTDVL